MTEFQVGDRVKSAFGEVCEVTEISKCGKGLLLTRESDGVTIGSDASICEFLSRFTGYDADGFAVYFLGFTI